MSGIEANAIMSRFVRIDDTNKQRPGESRGDFYCRLLQEYQEQMDIMDSAIVQTVKNGGNDIKLTDVQKEYLSETYNPQAMTQEEYEAFLEDLQKLGIVSGSDARILWSGASLRLNGIWGADSDGSGISHCFESCNGNLLDWVRFRASYVCQARDGLQYKDGTALLFDKLYRVLTQM